MKDIMVFFETSQAMEVEESLLNKNTTDLVTEVAQSLGIDYDDITFICTSDAEHIFYERSEGKN